MSATTVTSGFGVLLKRGDGGVGAGAKAQVEWGTSTAKIRIKAKTAGTAGNGKNITVVVSGSSFVTTAIDSTQVSITAPTSATVAMVIAYLYANSTFDTYYDADYGATPGDGTGTITARTITATSGGTDGTEAFTTVAEVTGIGGPGGSLELIDATHMESPSAFREYIASLRDSGELSVDLNFLPGNVGQRGFRTDMVNGTRRNWQLVWTDSPTTTWAFAGFVTGFEPSAAIDDKLAASATIKVTGPITVTP